MTKFDKETIIDCFNRSTWLEKAQNYLNSSNKLKKLSNDLDGYMNKDGLKEIKDQLLSLGNYLKEVITKGYNDYKDNAVVLIVAVIIYVVSSIDFIPDFLPGGFLDDSALVTWLFDRFKPQIEMKTSD